MELPCHSPKQLISGSYFRQNPESNWVAVERGAMHLSAIAIKSQQETIVCSRAKPVKKPAGSHSENRGGQFFLVYPSQSVIFHGRISGRIGSLSLHDAFHNSDINNQTAGLLFENFIADRFVDNPAILAAECPVLGNFPKKALSDRFEALY